MLLYDSKLHIFPGKLKSRLNGPYLVHKAYSMELLKLLIQRVGVSSKLMDIDLNHIWNL